VQPGEFLEQRGVEYKPSGSDQFVLRTCVFCGDEKWHLYMHIETGLFSCKKCGTSGSLWTFRRKLDPVDQVEPLTKLLSLEMPTGTTVPEEQVNLYEATLGGDRSALDWLFARGLTRGTIRKFRLGLLKEGMAHWLTIPYVKGGKVVNIKFRALPPNQKTFRVLPDHETPLFNVDRLDQKKPVFVTEGEFDTMMMVQQRYENTVSVPLGAGTFGAEHFDPLVVCGKVYLCYDMDGEGRRGALNVAQRLGPERCYLPLLPTKDPNDFFLKFTKADFESVLEVAKTAGRPSVLSLGQAFDELDALRSERLGEEPIRFGWRNVDRVVGPLRSGWVIVLQAIPKIGKTTFALNLCHDLSQRGIPSLLFCLEMPPRDLLERVVSRVRCVPVANLTDVDITMAKPTLYRLPLYLGRATEGELNVKRVFETIRYATKRFGVRLVVFDHIHFLCRSLEHSVAETGKVMRDFKLLFTELQVPGIVIAHPTKMDPNQMPGLYAARQSGEIPGDADVLITLYRKPMGTDKVSEADYTDNSIPTYEARTLVRVTASRFSGGGSAVLYFDDSTMQFREAMG